MLLAVGRLGAVSLMMACTRVLKYSSLSFSDLVYGESPGMSQKAYHSGGYELKIIWLAEIHEDTHHNYFYISFTKNDSMPVHSSFKMFSSVTVKS